VRATNILGHVENMPQNVCKTPTKHTRSKESPIRPGNQPAATMNFSGRCSRLPLIATNKNNELARWAGSYNSF
jgi:hypothetical protein